MILLATIAALAGVTACGGNDTSSDSPTQSPSFSVVSSSASSPEAPPSTEGANPSPSVKPESAAAPTIVGCQEGYDPIQTRWSDGTVTGYSEYCQGVRDQFVANEVNPESGPKQPVCESGLPCGITEDDGVVCDDSGCDAE
ncbi:hypothetical protein GOSPT_070_00240 [Gordonia sputi NBRC 100414]|uniref:Uncharacterized protein n=1 Tax=Gordonia sputi NBRC 100414 TaxID=1089453 RepID=H5U1C8_9ACTN|nr:hypothetical protein GOSPT_070_00240 [Gordonia sputi NBRC 100414]